MKTELIFIFYQRAALSGLVKMGLNFLVPQGRPSRADENGIGFPATIGGRSFMAYENGVEFSGTTRSPFKG